MIKKLICKLFGHKFLEDSGWEWCLRCGAKLK